jgi:formylmethanofuran dehydrogenase subunit C
MADLAITPLRQFTIPVTAECISPDFVAGKSLREIELTQVWEGNRRVKLGSLFKIAGEIGRTPNDCTIKIVGNVSAVRRIGYEMSGGSIQIDGEAGMYLGERMRGGTITVSGNAGSWLGTQMRGGQIEVKGNVGDSIGGSVRGGTKGMRGGTITIRGDCGTEAGAWMQNGMIKIEGNCDSYAGIHMKNGAVVVGRNCEGRAGAQMTGGKVIVLGNAGGVLPSFQFEEIRERAKAGDEKIPGPFYVFSGDVNEVGKGQLFARVSDNPDLKWNEQYLER